MGKIPTFLFAFFLLQTIVKGQDTTKVLFIGNSYTYSNNLPQMLEQVASSVNGSNFFYTESHTPGGSRLMTHATNPTVINLIKSKDWDFVVMQCQSQEPSFPITQVQKDVFPYAKSLSDTIRYFNKCAQPVFFMTWGRENGDAQNCASWPPVCTYEGMDSLLHERYVQMGMDNDALISPVGQVWNYLRKDLSSNINLYAGDGSHPSLKGSYAAAVTFYTLLTRSNPLDIMYDANIDPLEADTIRNVVHSQVYNKMAQWNVYIDDPVANFSYGMNPGGVFFSNMSTHADSYIWDFGDGSGSTQTDPLHTYSSPGSYTVTLNAYWCDRVDEMADTVNVVVSGFNELKGTELDVYPNPVIRELHIANIPLPNYVIHIYDITGKEVISTKDNIIDMSPFPAGVYFLNVETKAGISRTSKIIKK